MKSLHMYKEEIKLQKRQFTGELRASDFTTNLVVTEPGFACHRQYYV